MTKVINSNKNRRSRIWGILSFVFSISLLFACFVCYFKLNIYAFFFALLLPLLFLINFLFLFYWIVRRNKKNSFLSLISLLIYFIFFDSSLQLNSNENPYTNSFFSLMTFNVKEFGSTNSYRNLLSSKKILDFTKKENPDIVCFQEFSRFEFETFSYYPYKFIGYRSDFKKTLQVIYSNYPIVNKGFVDFLNTRNQTIYADIKIDEEIIRVYNIHLQSYMLIQGKSYFSLQGLKMVVNKTNKALSMQKKQVQIILNHAKSFQGKIIFTGDFNSTQYSKNYNYLKGGKKDSFVRAGFGLGITFPQFNYPFRLDYVLVDDSIEVLSHQNYDLKLSDHEPVLVKLKIE